MTARNGIATRRINRIKRTRMLLKEIAFIEPCLQSCDLVVFGASKLVGRIPDYVTQINPKPRSRCGQLFRSARSELAVGARWGTGESRILA
jgi:hypothetical protein